MNGSFTPEQKAEATAAFATFLMSRKGGLPPVENRPELLEAFAAGAQYGITVCRQILMDQADKV